jgi:DNA polymerase III sliding clamp (beta) subunit (PCNA family)
MHLRIDTQRLKNVLKQSCEIVNRKATIPIYSCIALEYSENNFYVYSSDQNQCTTIKIKLSAVEGINPGKIIVSGHTLYDIINLQDCNDIEIEDKTNFVEVRTPQSCYRLLNPGFDEYLAFPKSPDDWKVINGKSLREGLLGVSFAASDNPEEVMYRSVSWYPSGRLSSGTSTRIVSTQCSIPYHISIPVSVVNTLSKILNQETVLFGVSKNKQRATFVVENTDYEIEISIMLSNQFPPHEVLFQQKLPYVCTVNRLELVEALVKLYIKNTDDPIVEVSWNNNTLYLSDETGNATSEISCATVGECSFSIGYDHLYEYVKKTIVDEVSLEYNDINTPLMIRSNKSEALILTRRK